MARWRICECRQDVATIQRRGTSPSETTKKAEEEGGGGDDGDGDGSGLGRIVGRVFCCCRPDGGLAEDLAVEAGGAKEVEFMRSSARHRIALNSEENRSSPPSVGPASILRKMPIIFRHIIR
jgi:hypothetical protein